MLLYRHVQVAQAVRLAVGVFSVFSSGGPFFGFTAGASQKVLGIFQSRLLPPLLYGDTCGAGLAAAAAGSP